jgi:hypothetical protein
MAKDKTVFFMPSKPFERPFSALFEPRKKGVKEWLNQEGPCAKAHARSGPFSDSGEFLSSGNKLLARNTFPQNENLTPFL